MYKRPEHERYKSQFATVKTQGRVRDIPCDSFRTEFQRDVHRVIYSQSFRRLRHKTQVFYFPQNDHVSTRLDHVLFVASAARTVARCLGLNEDLAEAIGLAHDIGHAPFGHQGQDFLNEIIEGSSRLKKVLPYFSHELYGLRVVDKIAKRDREMPGLNLTWEVRDGIMSHCGEDYKTRKLIPGSKAKELEKIINRNDAGNPATLEGCIVKIIDKVAYCGKDIEDAISADLFDPAIIPTCIKKELGHTNGKIIGTILEDIVKESQGNSYIAISQKYGDLMHKLIDFNTINIYKSSKSERYSKQANKCLKLLFNDLLEKVKTTQKLKDFLVIKDETPQVYKLLKDYCDEYCNDEIKIYSDDDPDELIVLDFIAGMTDSFAVRSFQELFVPKATV